MVCLRDAPVHRRAFRRSHKKEKERGGGEEARIGVVRRGEERTRQDGEQRGCSVGEGSVVLVSLSLTLGTSRQALTNGGNKFRIKS